MKITRLLMALGAAGSVTLSAADLSKVADAKRWKPDECTVVQSGSAMVINMPVDHKAGQKDFPVGWPRLYLYKLNNKTTAVTVPLDKAKGLKNVVILGFNINEVQYKHGENVKFTVSDFKLINK